MNLFDYHHAFKDDANPIYLIDLLDFMFVFRYGILETSAELFNNAMAKGM